MKIGGLPVRYALLLTIVNSAVQLTTAYWVAATIDRVGRIRWFGGAFAVAAIAAFAGAFVTGVLHVHGWVPLLIFGVFMTTGTSVNSIGVYLYTPELYPTRMRALGTATASSLNRIASVFAMFGCVLIVAYVVITRWGTETSRQTLEEVSP